MAMARRVQCFVRRNMALWRLNKQRILVWWATGEHARQIQAKTKMQELLKRRERASTKEGQRAKARLNRLVAEGMEHAVPEHIKKQTIDYFFRVQHQQFRLIWMAWRHRHVAIQTAVTALRRPQLTFMQKLKSQPASPEAPRWSTEVKELHVRFDMPQQHHLAAPPCTGPRAQVHFPACHLQPVLPHGKGTGGGVGRGDAAPPFPEERMGLRKLCASS